MAPRRPLPCSNRRPLHAEPEIAHVACSPVLSWAPLCRRAGRMPHRRPILYSLIPVYPSTFREQSREHRDFSSVWSRTPQAPGPPRPRTDWPAGPARPIQALIDYATYGQGTAPARVISLMSCGSDCPQAPWLTTGDRLLTVRGCPQGYTSLFRFCRQDRPRCGRATDALFEAGIRVSMQ